MFLGKPILVQNFDIGHSDKLIRIQSLIQKRTLQDMVLVVTHLFPQKKLVRFLL